MIAVPVAQVPSSSFEPFSFLPPFQSKLALITKVAIFSLSTYFFGFAYGCALLLGTRALEVFLSPFAKKELSRFDVSYFRSNSIKGDVGVGLALALALRILVWALPLSFPLTSSLIGRVVTLGLPLVEEVFFRGYLADAMALERADAKLEHAGLGRVELEKNGVLAGSECLLIAIQTSALFALAHLQIPLQKSVPIKLFFTFSLGMISSALREKTKGLWSSCALHLGFNALLAR